MAALPSFMREDSDATVVKVLVLGASKAGKSALVARLCGGDFESEYLQTMGAALHVAEVAAGSDSDRERTEFNVWDCSGCARYTPFIATAVGYDDAGAVVLVYSTTNKASLQEASAWRQEALDQSRHGLPFVLVGTHTDKADLQEVSKDAAEEVARGWDAPHLMVSSRDGTGVDAVLAAVLTAVRARGEKAAGGPAGADEGGDDSSAVHLTRGASTRSGGMGGGSPRRSRGAGAGAGAGAGSAAAGASAYAS